MTKTTGFLALMAACAACCGATLSPIAVLVATLAASAALRAWGLAAGALLAIALAATALRWVRRKRRQVHAAGCADNCHAQGCRR